MEENNPQSNKNNGDIKTLHTYLTDMAETVRDNEVSVIKVALAEQNKHEKEDFYKKAQVSKSTKVLLALGGLLLVAIALAAVYFVIQKNKDINAPLPKVITQVDETAIYYDNQTSIDLTTAVSKTDFMNSIMPEIQKKEKADSIKNILLNVSTGNVTSSLKLSDLFTLMKMSAPSSLILSLSDQYMIGTYTPPVQVDVDGNPHLFLLFQVKDYNIAYAGMLQWEKTLLSDMYGIFNIDVSGNNSQLFETPFKDIIIENKDARILYDNTGKNILYYSFIDQDNLIITDSQDVIKEVAKRLLTKQTKPL